MSKKQLIFGLILIFIGLIFLLQTLDILWISFSQLIKFLFPIGLIIWGAWLIVRKRNLEHQTPPSQASTDWGSGPPPDLSRPSPPPSSPQPEPPSPPPPPPSHEPAASEASSGQSQSQPSDYARSSYTGAKTRSSNLFGDLNITCDNINMRNVEVSGFLGDIEVLLRQAKLETGLSRMVISGFIGDIRVMVPAGMAVFVRGSNFIGDMDLLGRRSSGFGNSIDGQTESYGSSDKKLYIAINCFIGDIRVIEV